MISWNTLKYPEDLRRLNATYISVKIKFIKKTAVSSGKEKFAESENYKSDEDKRKKVKEKMSQGEKRK